MTYYIIRQRIKSFKSKLLRSSVNFSISANRRNECNSFNLNHGDIQRLSLSFLNAAFDFSYNFRRVGRTNLIAAQTIQTLSERKGFFFVGNGRRFAASLSKSVASESRVVHQRFALGSIFQSELFAFVAGRCCEKLAQIMINSEL